MTVVPGATPDTIPDTAPIVAVAGVPLVQLPPPPSTSVIFDPTQTVPGPVIAPGSGLMVIGNNAIQPPMAV